MKPVRLGLLTLMAAFLVAAAGFGQSTDVRRVTHWTISEPTEIPGSVLAPGTYTIKVLNFQDGKEIVQFSDESDTKVLATTVAIRTRSNKPTGESQSIFTYYQRTAGAPQSLRTWMYPGDEWGEEFVYPKSRATQIAQISRESVAATENEASANLAEDVAVVTPQSTMPAKKQVEPAQPARVAQNTLPPASTPDATMPPEPRRLPKTGTDLPLLALVGVGTICGAGVLHRMRQQ
jgi:LPXTG-motif cell wall-anchored protein